MKKIFYKMCRYNKGFSLAEVIAAVIIGSMVLVTMLGIYSRACVCTASTARKLDSSRGVSEMLQRLTEDLNRVTDPRYDTKLAVENKISPQGYPGARLTIVKTFYNSTNEIQIFENIVWQTGYEGRSKGLTLYRSSSGIGIEDKLLDAQKDVWEKGLFVPICEDITFFKIQASDGENFKDVWPIDMRTPNGITVTISFADGFKMANGDWDVPEREKVIRTIAIDSTRKINFAVVKKDEQQGPQTDQPQDSNSQKDPNSNDMQKAKQPK